MGQKEREKMEIKINWIINGFVHVGTTNAGRLLASDKRQILKLSCLNMNLAGGTAYSISFRTKLQDQTNM